MQLTRRSVLIGGLAGAASLGLAACGDKSSGTSANRVTISVMGLPPTTNAATRTDVGARRTRSRRSAPGR